MSKLTAKQKIFCQQYIIDWNATRAAIAAGYSKKTAGFIGSENLKKPYIQTFIQEIQNDLEKTAGVSRLKVLQEHIKIAFGSIANFYNAWIDRKPIDELTEDQKTCIAEISTKTVTIMQDEAPAQVEYIRVKLHDKQRALENISKMLGYDAPLKSEFVGADGKGLFDSFDRFMNSCRDLTDSVKDKGSIPGRTNNDIQKY